MVYANVILLLIVIHNIAVLLSFARWRSGITLLTTRLLSANSLVITKIQRQYEYEISNKDQTSCCSSLINRIVTPVVGLLVYEADLLTKTKYVIKQE